MSNGSEVLTQNIRSVAMPNIFVRFRAYFSGVALYGMAIAIYSFLPYYRGFISRSDLDISYLPDILRHTLGVALAVLGANTYGLIIHCYIGYVVIGCFWFLFYPRARENTRTVIFWRVAGRTMRGWRDLFMNRSMAVPPETQLSKEEKSTMLFFLVKFFFVPVMVNFFFANLGTFLKSGHSLLFAPLADSGEGSNRLLYFTVLNFMLIVDTGFFVFGYLFEFELWGNELRSTESTIFGWVVTLACYPPLNGLVTHEIGWGSSDYAVFPSPLAASVTVTVSLALFFVYTWATVSLGLKASNLTNRGIVKTGPYAYVRHPAYITKNLHWLVMGLPLIAVNWVAALSIAGWAAIYFLRAVTEERHLLADPQYQTYCKKVPYRFIPGVI